MGLNTRLGVQSEKSSPAAATLDMHLCVRERCVRGMVVLIMLGRCASEGWGLEQQVFHFVVHQNCLRAFKSPDAHPVPILTKLESLGVGPRHLHLKKLPNDCNM